MELKSNEYQIECTPYGEYYAFLTDYHQCCTYGETAEEARVDDPRGTCPLRSGHHRD